METDWNNFELIVCYLIDYYSKEKKFDISRLNKELFLIDFISYNGKYATGLTTKALMAMKYINDDEYPRVFKLNNYLIDLEHNGIIKRINNTDNSFYYILTAGLDLNISKTIDRRDVNLINFVRDSKEFKDNFNNYYEDLSNLTEPYHVIEYYRSIDAKGEFMVNYQKLYKEAIYYKA